MDRKFVNNVLAFTRDKLLDEEVDRELLHLFEDAVRNDTVMGYRYGKIALIGDFRPKSGETLEEYTKRLDKLTRAQDTSTDPCDVINRVFNIIEDSDFEIFNTGSRGDSEAADTSGS